MKKRFKVLSIILILILCFLGACEQEPPFEGATYISPDAPQTPVEFNDITAGEIVAAMTIGWSLGNTMDAAGGETKWGNPMTRQSNFKALKDAGFNTIRIPVSWSNATSSNGAIRDSWMDRVTEIVNYAVANDMYIILNTHHDEGIFKFTNKSKDKSLLVFKAVWEQIAFNFRNYDEKLIFEGLNEPRTKGSDREWQGGTPDERANLNEHYQVFVDVVRASGGNNDKRILSINPYAGSAWETAVNGLVLPTDTVPDKLIVQIHAYEPYRFCLATGDWAVSTWNPEADQRQIQNAFNAANNKFVKNGIPVIMGEFGAMNRNNENDRAQWAEYYVGYARSLGIPCIWWDNGATTGSGELFGLLNRNNNTFVYPNLLDALLRGAGVKE